MANYWRTLWQRVSAQDVKVKAEVERIAFLQQAAAQRRAEYAAEQEQAALTGDTLLSPLLSSSRTRMADAEAAHTAALQMWENKQSRQKSR
jgi:hypothetical protein